MNLPRFPNPMELDQIRRPGAADRLAGHHHHCVAHLEAAAFEQHAVHLRQHLATTGGRQPGLTGAFFYVSPDVAPGVSVVCGGWLTGPVSLMANPGRRARCG